MNTDTTTPVVAEQEENKLNVTEVNCKGWKILDHGFDNDTEDFTGELVDAYWFPYEDVRWGQTLNRIKREGNSPFKDGYLFTVALEGIFTPVIEIGGVIYFKPNEESEPIRVRCHGVMLSTASYEVVSHSYHLDILPEEDPAPEESEAVQATLFDDVPDYPF